MAAIKAKSCQKSAFGPFPRCRAAELSVRSPVKALFEKTVEAGFGDNYWPAVVNVIDKPND